MALTASDKEKDPSWPRVSIQQVRNTLYIVGGFAATLDPSKFEDTRRALSGFSDQADVAFAG